MLKNDGFDKQWKPRDKGGLGEKKFVRHPVCCKLEMRACIGFDVGRCTVELKTRPFRRTDPV